VLTVPKGGVREALSVNSKRMAPGLLCKVLSVCGVCIVPLLQIVSPAQLKQGCLRVKLLRVFYRRRNS
jgi:hypothetical protein